MRELASKIAEELVTIGLMEERWVPDVIVAIDRVIKDNELRTSATYKSTMAETLDMMPVEDTVLKDRIQKVKTALHIAALEMIATSEALESSLMDTPARKELKLATGELRKLLESKQ